jgi:protease-4
MKFLGKAWRLLVGVKDGLVLIFMLLFFAVLYAGLSANPYAGGAAEGALLLDLRGTISEQPAEPDPVDLLSGGAPAAREYRLRDVIHTLDRAAVDERVKAVALDLDRFAGGGQAALGDVAAALGRVRKAGKPVVAYATGYSDDSYMLAAQASEIWLNPMGAVLVAGPGGTGLYFKGLLDKLGVTANVYRVGAYKAAVEPFTRMDMSPESREANQALAGALWENWQQDVAKARPKAQLQAYAMQPVERIAASGGDMAKAALAAGLVDRLGERIAFENRMRELVGTSDESRPGSFRTIKYDAWLAANPLPTTGGEIGILTVAGPIVDGKADPGTAGAETIVNNLERGLTQHDLKALVVRVDSPGGSVTASERIRQAVLEAKGRGIPVVVSMGSVAASGGYWVATPGDRIDRGVRDYPELRRNPREARSRRRRSQDDAALRRAGPAARPFAGGGPADPAWRREYLPALHRPRIDDPKAAGGTRPSDRARPGLGRRDRPPARPGRCLRIARCRDRRSGAAGEARR